MLIVLDTKFEGNIVLRSTSYKVLIPSFGCFSFTESVHCPWFSMSSFRLRWIYLCTWLRFRSHSLLWGWCLRPHINVLPLNYINSCWMGQQLCCVREKIYMYIYVVGQNDCCLRAWECWNGVGGYCCSQLFLACFPKWLPQPNTFYLSSFLLSSLSQWCLYEVLLQIPCSERPPFLLYSSFRVQDCIASLKDAPTMF